MVSGSAARRTKEGAGCGLVKCTARARITSKQARKLLPLVARPHALEYQQRAVLPPEGTGGAGGCAVWPSSHDHVSAKECTRILTSRTSAPTNASDVASAANETVGRGSRPALIRRSQSGGQKRAVGSVAAAAAGDGRCCAAVPVLATVSLSAIVYSSTRHSSPSCVSST